jgi:hypothetical protein
MLIGCSAMIHARFSRNGECSVAAHVRRQAQRPIVTAAVTMSDAAKNRSDASFRRWFEFESNSILFNLTIMHIAFASILTKTLTLSPMTGSSLSARISFKGGEKVAGDVWWVMFFLLRMAFWLGVVCLLLPSGGAKTASPEAQISATQAVTLASAAVADISGFCERQPDACKVGGKVAAAIGHKAEAGARTLYDLVATKIAERSSSEAKKIAAENPDGRSNGGPPLPPRNRGTLTQADLAPAWHAPVPLPPRRAARPSV